MIILLFIIVAQLFHQYCAWSLELKTAKFLFEIVRHDWLTLYRDLKNVSITVSQWSTETRRFLTNILLKFLQVHCISVNLWNKAPENFFLERRQTRSTSIPDSEKAVLDLLPLTRRSEQKVNLRCVVISVKQRVSDFDLNMPVPA